MTTELTLIALCLPAVYLAWRAAQEKTADRRERMVAHLEDFIGRAPRGGDRGAR